MKFRHIQLGPFYIGGSYCAVEFDLGSYSYQFWCYGAYDKFKFFNRITNGRVY